MKGKWHIPLLSFLGGALFAHTPHFLILALFLLWWLLFSSYRSLFPLLLVTFFLGVSIYTFSGVDDASPAQPPYHGEVISPVEKTEKMESFLLSTEEGETYQVVHFPPSEEEALFDDIKAGATCVTEEQAQEFPSARNPGEFDFKASMNLAGVARQIIIEQPDGLFCEGSSWKERFYEQRRRFHDTVIASVPPSLVPWVEALVFGEQRDLDEEVVKFFRDLGLSHILAISGLHVGLFAGLFYYFFYRTGFLPLSQVQALVLLVLPCFAFTAGALPSVMRASIMVIFVIIFSAFKIRPSMTDILSFTAFLLLFLEPSVLYNIGFQFSFAVTFSLLLSTSLFQQEFSKVNVAMRVSLIAQLSILPLQLHYFYQFSPLSVLFNLVLVPYFTVWFIPFLFLVVFSIFLLPPFFHGWLAQMGGEVHRIMMEMVVAGGEKGNIQWVTGAFPFEWFIPYYLCFLLMMYRWTKGEKFQGFLAGTALVAILFLFSAGPYFNEQGKVTFLDVGQGDSIVVELPSREGVFLIDAAGPQAFLQNTDKTADSVILPYLKSQGISKVDALFITHNDSDHNGSVPRLLEADAVDRLYVSEFDERDYGRTVTRLKRGDQFQFGTLTMHILGPAENREDKNDDSLVMYADLGGSRWMFTGDISSDVEKELVSHYGEISVDYVKSAHHGSKTSTSELFMKTYQPEAVVISAGVNNRYGHPHKEVLKRLHAYGTEIWRTDERGAVTFSFSKRRQEHGFSGFLPVSP